MNIKFHSLYFSDNFYGIDHFTDPKENGIFKKGFDTVHWILRFGTGTSGGILQAL
jgi:hypothetical protein